MERMSTLDAGFFYLEQPGVPMHLGSVAVFDGPAPALDDLACLMLAKLPLVPRYAQVVRAGPGQIFRPAWVDDERFDIGQHLHSAAVPASGRPEQLCDLAADIFARPLDRARPLWEAWLLEGLPDQRWALLSKVHHCMVDGIGGADLMSLIFDLSPDAPLPERPASQPTAGPSTARLVADGLADGLTWPLGQMRDLPARIRTRLPKGTGLQRYVRGLADSARWLAVPSASSLNGPAGGRRRWTWLECDRAQLRQVSAGLGGTVNDVLLAAVCGGFRDLLEKRGDLKPGLVVRSLVPVSVRGSQERGLLTNRLSAFLVNLPVAEPDPLRRLLAVRAQMDQLKRTGQAAGPLLLTDLLGMSAPPALAAGLRAAFRLPQPLVQTVTTNVPGPRVPLYVAGRRMAAAYPYVAIGGNVRISTAAFSYLDGLYFGITADRDTVPDLPVLTDGIGRSLAELADLAAQQRAQA